MESRSKGERREEKKAKWQIQTLMSLLCVRWGPLRLTIPNVVLESVWWLTTTCYPPLVSRLPHILFYIHILLLDTFVISIFQRFKRCHLKANTTAHQEKNIIMWRKCQILPEAKATNVLSDVFFSYISCAHSFSLQREEQRKYAQNIFVEC